MHTKHAFLVGLTSILALLILTGLLMVFGEFDRLLMPSYAIEVHTNDAAGLRPGSAVAVNGIRVGQVDVVELQPDPAYPVRVVALIGEQHRVPAAALFEIDQPLLGGSSVLSFAADPTTDSFLPTDGTAQIQGPYRTMLERISDSLMSRFQPLTEAMDSVASLSSTLEAMAADMREMTRAQDPSAVAGGAESPNIRTAVLRLNTLLDDARRTLALADGWLGDEQLQADARAAVQRANTVFDDASTALTRYTKLADSLEADADQLLRDARPVLDDVSATLEQIRLVAASATEGDGTVAQLLNNPELYRSVEDAAVRLERVLTELQLLIQKVKAEGLPLKL